MAMLAEPRQRKRYNLTPRGRALYEDDTRFGTKMLEKMGWSKGKGLGANENGSQDFVRVRMRNNNEGLGFEDRDDHWTQHEESFSGLLKTLNGESNSSADAVEENASDEELPRVGFGFGAMPKSKPTVDKLKEKFSGESLEEKSKRSKARVHYKKFTKGKDLSQYSEKDLANIFGKKVVEAQQANGVYEQLTAIAVREEQDEKEDKSVEEVNPNFAGVQTISTGLSVSEYFKQKMEAIKNRMRNGTGNNDIPKAENVEEKAAEDVLLVEDNKKSKKKKRLLEESELVEIDAVAEDAPKKKKRKKANNGKSEEQVTLLEDAAESKEPIDVGTLKEVSAEVALNELSKKKKKKKDLKAHEEEVHLIEADVENTEIIEKDKKKKNKKKKTTKVEFVEAEMKEYLAQNNTLPDMETACNPLEEEHIKNKIKKNKKLNKEQSTECGKKSKKTKNLEATNEETSTYESVNTTPLSNTVKKSKKDVSATDEIANTSMTLDDLIAKCNSYNVYTVSSFCAEKFRKSDLELFVGSNLSQFPGYSYDDQLKLNVKVVPGDEKRITQLWNCTVDKYCNADPKHSFHKYIQQVNTARKTKQKLPRFHVKPWKRRNAFQAL